ncbi:peptide chain release factor N(5)-glutamine methyltransferase [Halomonas sp. ZH2S]|uniref:Release factor glutamine methyltransferase n=1 Tax=Vreelandella zhuhanensis TaxID=2684210 RepID=A0A7X3GZF5_9GAMM|nr:peptide chain release factor N(5)-glutamine methyltransferase [Halomonas zhuhanensis]MWJ27710.1 peptide chain release factor N(5)-glutamine methyltransferase [Halomonas zhuhanensis]
MTLDTLVMQAAKRLKQAGSSSPRLDADVLLCHVLGRERAWLYTWGDKPCPTWQHARFDALIAARVQGMPVAYLTGEREFWGLRLATSPETLIPRPDTETLVEAALAQGSQPGGRLLDLGSGTGAIALAFASERPGWQVVGVDIREQAVALARDNARRLALANVTFQLSDWFAALDDATRFDVILSNPPYIAADDPHLTQGDVRFEPASALVAEQSGLADLYHLIASASAYLESGGWLLLEHGYTQALAVQQALREAGYVEVQSRRDLGGHERVTLGRWLPTPA